MKKQLLKLSLVTLFAGIIACNKNITTPSGTVVLDIPDQPYSYFQPNVGDTTSNNKATLGRVLFYDSRLSLNNSISCASCHKQEFGFADNVARSVGFEGRLTGRNSKGFVNLVGKNNFFMPELLNSNFALLFWDGRENNLKNLVNRPITNHVEMGISDPSALPEKIASVSWYPKLFSKAYPNDGQITSERISECIAVFMASVRGTSSKFDRYQAGDKSAFNALEADGFNLFTTKYNCASCHQIFTNSYNENTAFSDIGLDASYNDNGRGAISRTATDNGKFRVPSLENVALTAPYMHDGRFKTLDEVIDHYSKGIKYSENLDLRLVDTARTNARAMNISASEKARLIAFLNTMTDYSMVTNTMYSNPFKIKK